MINGDFPPVSTRIYLAGAFLMMRLHGTLGVRPLPRWKKDDEGWMRGG